MIFQKVSTPLKHRYLSLFASVLKVISIHEVKLFEYVSEPLQTASIENAYAVVERSVSVTVTLTVSLVTGPTATLSFIVITGAALILRSFALTA